MSNKRWVGTVLFYLNQYIVQTVFRGPHRLWHYWQDLFVLLPPLPSYLVHARCLTGQGTNLWRSLKASSNSLVSCSKLFFLFITPSASGNQTSSSNVGAIKLALVSWMLNQLSCSSIPQRRWYLSSIYFIPIILYNNGRSFGARWRGAQASLYFLFFFLSSSPQLFLLLRIGFLYFVFKYL